MFATQLKALSLTLAVALSPLAVAEVDQHNASQHSRQIDIDSKVITEHKARINGDRLSYTAETGTQPVWDDQGHCCGHTALHIL